MNTQAEKEKTALEASFLAVTTKYLKAGIAIVIMVCALVWIALSLISTWERYHAESAEYAPPPEGMVFIPAGYFIAGNDAPDADHTERPQRRYTRAFYIDIHEVTNAEYQRFDPAHIYPKGQENYPVVKVGKDEARAFASWAGKRLPTSDEWEKAARGTDGRRYPWGDEYDQEKANLGGNSGLQPVGTYPVGASPYGVLDMAGNAWEWVEDTYNDKSLFGADLGFQRGIIRGGAYSYAPHQGQTFHVGFECEDLTCGDLGFRCVKDAERL